MYATYIVIALHNPTTATIQGYIPIGYSLLSLSVTFYSMRLTSVLLLYLSLVFIPSSLNAQEVNITVPASSSSSTTLVSTISTTISPITIQAGALSKNPGHQSISTLRPEQVITKT